jgi:hypothetical protein
MARTLLYRCPITGQTVQAWSAEEVDDDNLYDLLECLACMQGHFINLKTGKVLGEEDD